MLTAAVFATYGASLGNDWVNIDDLLNVHLNRELQGEKGHPLLWPWTSFTASLYRPLAWHFVQLQYLLNGPNAYWFHAASVALHAATVVALYFFGVELIRAAAPKVEPGVARWSAGWAAALFALHPLRAETVAWFSAQAYLQCGLFGTLATTSYLRWHATGDLEQRRRQRAWTCGLFAAALLSHPAAAMIPFVWLILDWTPLHRLRLSRWRELLAEKLPMFAFSAVFMLLAMKAKAANQSLEFRADLTIDGRLAQAAHGLVFYFEKTLWPTDLFAFYVRPAEISIWKGRFAVEALLAAAMTAAALLCFRRAPGMTAAWLAFVVILAPNLGLVQIGDYMAADRYAYLPFLALTAAAAVGLAMFASKRPPGFRFRSNVVGVVLVAAMIPLTWKQAATWSDSLTLWKHAVEHGGENSAVVRSGYGFALYRARRSNEALEQIREAVRLDGGLAPTRLNLALMLAALGDYAEALEHTVAVVRQHPDSERATNQLAGLLINGVDHSQTPQSQLAEAHRELATALALQGKAVLTKPSRHPTSDVSDEAD